MSNKKNLNLPKDCSDKRRNRNKYCHCTLKHTNRAKHVWAFALIAARRKRKIVVCRNKQINSINLARLLFYVDMLLWQRQSTGRDFISSLLSSQCISGKWGTWKRHIFVIGFYTSYECISQPNNGRLKFLFTEKLMEIVIW